MKAGRALLPGVTAHGKTVGIYFGTKTIETMAGQTVLAALVAAGEMVCRTTPGGAPRGVFCGMGLCQDCILDIDGVPNQRACMTPVRAGMVVAVAEPRPEPTAAVADPEMVALMPEVLVIGGGPAGLAAAAVAAEAGLDVVLIDERSKLGGQFYKQPADGFRIDERAIDKQFRNGRALIDRVAASGVRCILGMTAWAAFGADEVWASSSTSSLGIRPKRVVLATGAYERGVPLPGWTLPGFMTTGAAQTLLRSYQIAPGSRIVLGGNGPLNLQVAAELVSAGVTVVALVEAAARPGPRTLTSLASMAIAAPGLVRDGLAYRNVLRRARVPIFHRHAIVHAEGREAVRQARIAEIDDHGNPVAGTEKSFDADVVCTGYGFVPSNEIARAMGCRHRFDEALGHLVAERDHHGRSSVAHVWIIGDSGGLGGARAAEAAGIIAGADVARDLGRKVRQDREVQRAMAAVVRAKRFQSALWTLFRAPRIVDQLAKPDTILCRCEEVSVATVHAAVVDGKIATAGAVKRLTRAGMGRCQGRYCGALVVELVARHSGTGIDEFCYFAPRMPFKPVPVATVSAGA
jgi:NADPH-dependent 2,4-dienoyl-CoA reductase/sulfur reductase-like enzyme